MYLSRLRRFLDRLRESHQAEWLVLDGPSLVLSSFGQNSFKFLNYIVKCGYRSLQDDKLAELGDTARAYLLATAALIGLMFLSAFTSMLLV